MDNGALSTTSGLRTKIRSSVQQAFEVCLSPPDYASFIALFTKQNNNNRDFFKITADSDGSFRGPSHFWTDDGALAVLPDIIPANVDALFLDHGAASGGAGQASSSMPLTVRVVKIHLPVRLPIPEDCNQIATFISRPNGYFSSMSRSGRSHAVEAHSAMQLRFSRQALMRSKFRTNVVDPAKLSTVFYRLLRNPISK